MMKPVQFGRTLLKSSTLPFPFLLPAFSQSSLPAIVSSRQFSSDVSLRAAASTAAAPKTSTTSTTTAPRRPPHSNEVISEQLGAIVSNARPRSNDGGSLRGLKAQQESLMAVMGISASDKGTYVAPINPPERLHAYLGRTINVNEKSGLQGALRLLDMSLAKNRVRTEHNQQRFHERAGMKRKRLKSTRWALRFKAGFKEMVSKVKTMRKMGW